MCSACVKIYIPASDCNFQLSLLHVCGHDCSVTFHIVAVWLCHEVWKNTAPLSVKRCVICVHYEISENPLPPSLATDYMDQILKKKINMTLLSLQCPFFALLLLSNFLSRFFFSSCNFFFFFSPPPCLSLQGQHRPEEDHLFPGWRLPHHSTVRER